MHIHIHIHDDREPRLERIEAMLTTLIKGEKMTRQEAERLDKITTAIAARLKKLIDAHANDLTPEEQAEVDKDFAALEALGHDSADPLPPPAPPNP